MHAETMVKAAARIAKKVKAAAILILTETGEGYDFMADGRPDIPVIVATANDETFKKILNTSPKASTVDLTKAKPSKKKNVKTYAIKLMTRGTSRTDQIADAIVVAMQKGILNEDDTITIVGSTLAGEADSLFIYKIDKEKLDSTIYDLIKKTDIGEEAFEIAVNIALEIGKEGREGRLIGTAFLIGDSKKVLKNSTQLILNPFEGHVVEDRTITNPDISETVKEFAQLEGVFVISKDGVIEAAGRYLDVDTSEVDIPRGLGTRHAAVAAMTVASNAIGVAVSQSGGIVRIFKNGEVVMRIEPQRKISLKTDSLKRK
jgi:DNA integrity scanning protein DisA with diadenylate cyclase activity